jgi:hypothetical protein
MIIFALWFSSYFFLFYAKSYRNFKLEQLYLFE